MAMNALLQHLVEEVISLTSRPDLVADTIKAVRSATYKLHMQDFYTPDLLETGISFSEAKNILSLDIYDIVPNFRRLHYIRKSVKDFSSTTGYSFGDFLTKISPLQSRDEYGREKVNVYYPAGRTINIRSSTAEQFFLFGIWLKPVLAEEKFESWIAREAEYAIIYDAAATIFKTTGYDEQAAQIRQDTLVQARTIITNYISSDVEIEEEV